jgi:PAT family beta-lactamase induction signal transducer AmpG
LSTPAGYAAEVLGWPGFWMLTMVVALPGLVLLWILWRQGFVVSAIRQPGTQVAEA